MFSPSAAHPLVDKVPIATSVRDGPTLWIQDETALRRRRPSPAIRYPDIADAAHASGCRVRRCGQVRAAPHDTTRAASIAVTTDSDKCPLRLR